MVYYYYYICNSISADGQGVINKRKALNNLSGRGQTDTIKTR